MTVHPAFSYLSGALDKIFRLSEFGNAADSLSDFVRRNLISDNGPDDSLKEHPGIKVELMSIAIEMKAVSKTYWKGKRSRVKAVDRMDLSVPAGQMVGLLGPSGAGKTTSLRMLAGLEKPASGQIRLNGYDLASQRDAAMGQVGAVIQGARALRRERSIWENLIRAGVRRGHSEEEIIARAEELLNELDMMAWRDDLVSRLPFEIQNKAEIACAFVADPPIGLFDEWSWCYEEPSSEPIKSWIRNLTREKRKTVVIATRQTHLAQHMCDRVAVINRGRLLADLPITKRPGLSRETYYEIRVTGRLDARWKSWFGSLRVKAEGSETVISGTVADQSALHGLLVKVRDLGLPLISVSSGDSALEDVLARLRDEEGRF